VSKIINRFTAEE